MSRKHWEWSKKDVLSPAEVDDKIGRKKMPAIEGAAKSESPDERRSREIDSIMQSKGCSYNVASILHENPWLQPIPDVIASQKAKLVDIEQDWHRQGYYSLIIKPTHCSPKLQRARVSFIVSKDGVDVIEALKGGDDVVSCINDVNEALSKKFEEEKTRIELERALAEKKAATQQRRSSERGQRRKTGHYSGLGNNHPDRTASVPAKLIATPSQRWTLES